MSSALAGVALKLRWYCVSSTPESARAIIAYLDERVPLDPALRAAVLGLCDRG